MPEQAFYDAERQLIVRLGDETLVYAPTVGQGWQCRLDDIAWPSSRISPRGVHEVRLHAADGRVAAALPEFDQIERFYLLLVRQLAARPFFEPVRASVPGHVRYLERVLWLAAQSRLAGESWEALHVEEHSLAAATPDGLLLMPTSDARAERISWRELSGIRRRSASSYVERDVVRFFGTERHVDLALENLPEEFYRRCEMRRQGLEAEGIAIPPYRIPEIECADESLAMTYSWEIEAARADRLLVPGETVIACAFGGSGGSFLPGSSRERVTPPVVPADAGTAGDITEPDIRTELLLTDRRLLQVDRRPGAQAAAIQVDLSTQALPLIRRSGTSLTIGTFALVTDTQQPWDIAGDFYRRYRSHFTTVLDPFAHEPRIPTAPARTWSTPTGTVPDPFSTQVDASIYSEPPGTGPWRP